MTRSHGPMPPEPGYDMRYLHDDLDRIATRLKLKAKWALQWLSSTFDDTLFLNSLMLRHRESAKSGAYPDNDDFRNEGPNPPLFEPFHQYWPSF